MLSSWKEIAHFFGKGVRTVQRWEKTLNLPIRRPPGAPSNVVLARTSDLEAWMHRGPGKAAVASSEGTADGVETGALLSELEHEIRAVVEHAGGNLPSHEGAAEAEGAVFERMKQLLDDLRSTGLAGEATHPLKRAA